MKNEEIIFIVFIVVLLGAMVWVTIVNRLEEEKEKREETEKWKSRNR